jgi:hypothetical protein
MQTMKIKAKQVHVLGAHGSVELVEASQNAIVHLCVDLRSFATRPQIAQRFVFECLDHKATRIRKILQLRERKLMAYKSQVVGENPPSADVLFN